MTPIFHELRVRSVQPDTPEAVVVSFEVPPQLQPVFGFTQGQYLTLRKLMVASGLIGESSRASAA